VLQVQLQSVDPPEQVIAAFKDVTPAQQDQNRLRKEAEAYANRVVPEARGKAAAIVQEAEGYKLQTVAQATGQVSRFNQIYEQYKKAPEVTRERLYLETMERVLAGTDKIILDQSGGQGQGGRSLFAAWALDAAGGRRRPQVKGAGGQRRRRMGKAASRRRCHVVESLMRVRWVSQLKSCGSDGFVPCLHHRCPEGSERSC
jgi:hypothetical protein